MQVSLGLIYKKKVVAPYVGLGTFLILKTVMYIIVHFLFLL